MPRIPLLVLIAMTLSAAEHHLASDGDDARDGLTPATAWRSLERASRQIFAPGDRLLLRGGDRFPGSLTLQVRDGGDPLRPVIVASTGDRPAVIAAGAGTGIAASDAGVTLRDLHVIGDGSASNSGDGVLFLNLRPGGDRRHGIRCERLVVSGFRRAGIGLLGWPEDGSASGFAEVVIEDCRVSDVLNYGIWSGGHEQPRGSWRYSHADVTVRGCVAHGITGDPGYHDNHSGNGILLGNVDVALIEGCAAYDNGRLCDCRVGGPVGIWTYCSRRVVIQRCESFRNRSAGTTPDGGGFDLDGGTVESVLQYNYSHDNDGAGFLIYSYRDAPHEFRDNIVRFNVSIDDGRKGRYGGISVGQHGDHNRNTLIHHNTVIVSARAGARPSALMAFSTTGLRVHSNLFVTHGGAPLLDTWDGAVGTAAQVTGNRWWSAGAPPQWRSGTESHGDAAAWRVAAGLAPDADQIGDPGLPYAPAERLFPAAVGTLAGLQPLADAVGQPTDAPDFAGRTSPGTGFAGAFLPR